MRGGACDYSVYLHCCLLYACVFSYCCECNTQQGSGHPDTAARQGCVHGTTDRHRNHIYIHSFIHYALLHVDKRNPGTMQITNAIKLLTKSN